MKIKDGFLLRDVAGTNVVIPAGAVDFDGMITLNETGTLIWNLLEKGTTEAEILSAFLQEYDVSEEVASRDIQAFLKRLSDAKLLES